MESVHVSMASGGAFLGIHSAFWHYLEQLPGGVRFRSSVTSYSGSSAGALAAASLSRGIPARYVMEDVYSGGFGRHKVLRAIAVFFRLKKTMYSGSHYQQRLARLCARTPQFRRMPVSIAVTNKKMQQRCLQYGTFATNKQVVNAATASASIPYMLPAVHVIPEGECVDGSISQQSFPEATVLNALRNSNGTLVLLNCVPWPGFRKDVQITSLGARLRNMYGSNLYSHGMESLTRDIANFKYHDGIFDIRIDNSSGVPVLSNTGNLHVLFVAPTETQFNACGGGSNAVLNLDYKASSPFIVKVAEQGRQMAREFAVRYCSLAL